jgi:ABC-type sugar transport system ATPase subunit
MRIEIRRLHQRLNATSIFVTHDQIEAMTLADRLVVMNAGRIEQIGAPAEVYRRPSTHYVAGFIGSPAMNFMPGRAAAPGMVELDGGGRIAHTQGAIDNGRAVVVGVRPEHLTASAAADSSVSGRIEMIEQLGADTLTHIAHGGATVILRTPHDAKNTVGATLSVAAEPSRVYLFDAASGARVRA